MTRNLLSPAAGETARNVALWAGCLAGPLAWFAQLCVTYALAAGECGSRGRVALHLVTLACLLAVAGGARVAWRSWAEAGRAWPSAADEGPTARARLLGSLGVLTSLLCAVVMLAQWCAVAFLDPCPL